MARTLTVTIHDAEMPDSINGLLLSKEPDCYSIMINSKKNPSEQAAAFLHECLHIYHKDTESDRSPDSIEKERNKEIISLLEILTKETEG